MLLDYIHSCNIMYYQFHYTVLIDLQRQAVEKGADPLSVWECFSGMHSLSDLSQVNQLICISVLIFADTAVGHMPFL